MIEFISSAAFALKREEDVSQLAQRAMRPDFRGASGAFENIGHFGKGEFLKAAEQKNLAVIVMESAQRDVE